MLHLMYDVTHQVWVSVYALINGYCLYPSDEAPGWVGRAAIRHPTLSPEQLEAEFQKQGIIGRIWT